MAKRKYHWFLPLPTIILLWVIVFLFSLSNSSCAQNALKIKLVPSFLDLPDEYRGNSLNKPQDLKRVVLDRIVSKNDKKFVMNVWDLSKEEIFEFFLSSPVPNDPKQFDADYFLWGAFDEREGVLNLDLTSIRTARSISASIDLTQPLKKGIADEIIDSIQLMFSDEDRINEINTIKAGEIVDVYNSVVQYRFQTVEEVDLGINFEYDGLQDYVLKVSFEKEEKELSLPSRLTLTGDDGYFIYLNFGSDMKLDPNKDVSVNFRPEGDAEIKKDFIVKSREKSEIVFHFWWKAGSIQGVQISPKINPYKPQTYKVR